MHWESRNQDLVQKSVGGGIKLGRGGVIWISEGDDGSFGGDYVFEGVEIYI